MNVLSASSPRATKGPWPRPPACLTAANLHHPPEGARVAVAGLVILRQRPGTANGVIFLTLEDETGVVNVVVWRALYEHARRAVIAGRLLRVTGRIQRQSGVVHIIAEQIEDLSSLLDRLLIPSGAAATQGHTGPDGGEAETRPLSQTVETR